MCFTLLKQPNYASDGVEKLLEPSVLEPDFQALANQVYGELKPAQNATNLLPRGIGWGVWTGDGVHWSEKDTYQLSAKFNSQEGGRVRTMTRLPSVFLESRWVNSLIGQTFRVFHPQGDPSWNPYVVQLSAIRYPVNLTQICMPSPPFPHQDAFNNGIWVISKTPGILGGQSRVFTLDDQPLFETTLHTGEGLMVEDERYKHQVLPMMVDIETAKGGEIFRDILIVRIDPIRR